MNRNILYFTLSLLILLGILAAAYLLYQEYYARPITTPTTSITPQDQQVSPSYLKAGIAEFIANSQQPDGGFPIRFKCDLSNCEAMAANPESPTGWAILGLLAGADTSAQERFATAADTAMERVMRICTNDPRVCASNFYAIEHYFALTNDAVYEAALEKATEHVRNTVVNWPDEVVLRSEIRPYSKLAIAYGYKANPQDYDLIMAAADTALELWSSDGFNDEPLYTNEGYEVDYLVPYVANDILLPAYRLSGDARYLDAARDFFSKAAVDQNLEYFSWEGGLVAILNSVEVMAALSKVETLPADERESYVQQSQSIMQQLIAFHYDDPQRPALNGTHGIRTGHWTNNELPGINYKNVNLNGWIGHILTDDIFKDTEFTLVGTEMIVGY